VNRILLAFRCFFDIQFRGRLSDDAVAALGLSQAAETPTPTAAISAPASPQAPPPAARTSDGALQMLAILQRDARLLDFLMEEISGYTDDQVGAAVRELHDQCRESVSRYVALEPVIDGVEGTYTHAPSSDPGAVKFVGNVPAQPPSGGILRHRGWRAATVDLPVPGGQQDVSILAPAEIEVE
jgi:hypothetical protein